MYCKNCGTNLPDGSTFCSTCGTKIYQEQPSTANYGQEFYSQNYQTVYSNLAEPKKSNAAKIVIITGSILLIAVISAIIFILLTSENINKSPETVLKAHMEALSEDDADAFMETLHPSMKPIFALFEMDSDDALMTYQYCTFDYIGETDLTFSNIIIEDSYQLTQDEIDEYLSSDDNFTYGDEYYIIDGTVTVKNKSGNSYTCLFTSSIIEEDGKYYVSDIYLEKQ